MVIQSHNFHSFEVVDRVSETQLQVGENYDVQSSLKQFHFGIKFNLLRYDGGVAAPTRQHVAPSPRSGKLTAACTWMGRD